jgi:hypothetical protein
MTVVRRPALRVLGLLAAALLTGTGPAAAADYIGTAAEQLRKQPLWIDPAMREVFTDAETAEVRARLRDATTPVFLAVLPAEAATEAPSGEAKWLPSELARATGRAGTYAAILGSSTDSAASMYAGSSVIGQQAGDIAEETAKANHNPADAVLAFVDEVERAAQGEPPAGAADEGDDSGGTAVPWLLLLVGGGGAAALVVRRRRRAERERTDAAQLATLRGVVDEDITSFGEVLDAVDLGAPGTDDVARDAYQHALDSYERAKQRMAAARRPGDVRAVTEALEEGRFSLACVRARQAGQPLPERRPPCFFDPRHGPSVEDVSWTPDGGAPREVPVCAADAARIRDGLEPIARTVPVGGGRRPYWEAGPAYAPWASGWFGAYGSMLLPGLLVGTMLGSSFEPYDTAPAHDAGADSGDWSDFGGGGGDFGDFGGGGGDFG